MADVYSLGLIRILDRSYTMIIITILQIWDSQDAEQHKMEEQYS